MTNNQNDLKPIPVGTKVTYTGSLTSRHGVYLVNQHLRPQDHPAHDAEGFDDSKPTAYPDGVAYELCPTMKFGDRGRRLFFVRRDSIAVVKVVS